MTALSHNGVVVTITFFLGLLLFLLAFASSDWLGIEDGLYISLWRTCKKNFRTGVWVCEPWDRLPDFVRAAQGFCVVGLLTYAVSLLILVGYVAVHTLQEMRGVLVALCLLIFSAGCMTLMAMIVMGVKGRDYCQDIKSDTNRIFEYMIEGWDPSGYFRIGWSFIVAIFSSAITLVSFAFTMLEFVRVNDLPMHPHQ